MAHDHVQDVSEEAYRIALKEWERRFDASTNLIEKVALMGELQEYLRPDIWERNRRREQWIFEE